jgi:hypothetical protein
MKKLLLLGLLLGSHVLASSQNSWPREIPLKNGGVITIYQPQPESYSGNQLSARAAVSVKTTAKAEPVFGAVWADASTATDRDNRMLVIETIQIKQVKFPGQDNADKIEAFKKLLEEEIPKWELAISIDQLTTSLERNGVAAAADLKNDPPKIIYSNKPAMLVLIDGQPRVEKDKNSGMERVVNSPFPIVKQNGISYLFTGKYWYRSSNVLSGWSLAAQLPASLKKIDEELKKQAREKAKELELEGLSAEEEKPTAIIVSTEPAELIQSDGAPHYQTLEGTSLLYVENSPNDIFKDINNQKTYTLIAGRWYAAPSINGPWTFVEADKLPADFANIREGGEKDHVLASVAGTNAANEAVLDAMIPQTATVDRKSATLEKAVEYDGTPQFERIQGTNLELAVNTSSTIMRQNGTYYAVENGIWFESASPQGPWRVSTRRPTDVENIPASSPAYNTRYVYIYDVRPDVVVVGYTPGYLNSFIYGPTVVYGTGWYYRPWWGTHYYPRPCTWGFGMNYNPWTGWSFNWGFSWSMGPFSMGFSSGGFHYGFGFGWGGGWFGAPVYRPPYRPPYWNGGYYGHRPGYGRPGYGRPNINVGGDVNINIGGNQNIYNKLANRGVQTRNIYRGPGSSNFTSQSGNMRPSIPGNRPNLGNNKLPRRPNGNTGRPAPNGRPQARPARPGAGDVFADKQGNIFKRDDNGNWNLRDRDNWRPADNNRDLDRMQQLRDRGRRRDRSFEQNRPLLPSAGGRPTTRPAMPSRPSPAARPAGRPSPGARPAARPSVPRG